MRARCPQANARRCLAPGKPRTSGQRGARAACRIACCGAARLSSATHCRARLSACAGRRGGMERPIGGRRARAALPLAQARRESREHQLASNRGGRCVRDGSLRGLIEARLSGRPCSLVVRGPLRAHCFCRADRVVCEMSGGSGLVSHHQSRIRPCGH